MLKKDRQILVEGLQATRASPRDPYFSVFGHYLPARFTWEIFFT